MRQSASFLEEPLIKKESKARVKKTVNMGKLTNVVNDENMLQLMERNFTCSTNTTNAKVLPSNRELNDLVTSTNLKMLKQENSSGATPKIQVE